MPAPSSGQLLFKSDSEPVSLGNDMRMNVTQRLEEIATSCSFPQASRQDWKEKIFTPYGFQVSYATPKEMTFKTYKGGDAGEIWKVTDIMLPLEEDPAGSGIYVKTQDQAWTYLFKCDGAKMVDLVCQPDLQKYYPQEGALYQLACQNQVREDELRNAANDQDAPSTDLDAATAPAAGNETGPALEKISGAARLLVSDDPRPVKDSSENPAPAEKTRAAKDIQPLIVPQKGAAFEVQGDEMIIQ